MAAMADHTDVKTTEDDKMHAPSRDDWWTTSEKFGWAEDGMTGSTADGTASGVSKNMSNNNSGVMKNTNKHKDKMMATP